MSVQIFISYRRNGGEFLGKCLYDVLCREGYSVFYDVEAMNAGKFNDQIYRRIEECSDFLLLLTPGCLERCMNDGDWVRLEYEHAVKCGKRIIPIAAREFVFPAVMPMSMCDLPDYERVEATAGDMEYVVRKLKRLMSAKPAKGKTGLFSTLSTPALTPTAIDFIQRKGELDDLSYFEPDYDIAHYWQYLKAENAKELQSGNGLADGYLRNFHQNRLHSLWQTLCVLRDMKILSSAPHSTEDSWCTPEILNTTALHELLVSAYTYCSYGTNWNPTHYQYKIKKNCKTKIRGAFTYQGQTYQLLDVIEYVRTEDAPPQKYAIAVQNRDLLLPNHTVFQVNPDDSLVLLEWNTQLCKEVFVWYTYMYRMLTSLPLCYTDDYNEALLSTVHAGTSIRQIYEVLRGVALKSVDGYWKPKGILKKKMYIHIDPKDHSNMYYEHRYGDFITENGKEAVLDVVDVSQPYTDTYNKNCYVLSVPIVKMKDDGPKNWRDEPHIWYVTTSIINNDSENTKLTMEYIEKVQGFLSEEILERFALMMQLYRQEDLFLA